MSEVKVNKISPRTNCGTVQLGDSGDTITIPAGATITNNGTAAGFGSTGEVSWNTTKITADPGNAVSGVGYFTDTSGGAFSVTLPSSPSAGNVVAVADYANTWDTNNLTIARNGSNIEGAASDFVCNTEGSTITFVYVDATKGWVVTNSGNSSQAFEARYVTASGGTETTSGNFKIHTFTGPGTFTVSCAGNPAGSTTVDYLVVAGAGGGGMGGNAASLPNPSCQKDGGGGGGAGGYRESSGAASGCYTRSPLGACVAALPVTVTGYPVTVGAGGSGAPDNPTPGTSGGNSIFAGSTTITSTGGGGGASKNAPGGAGSCQQGLPGGSGGGASHRNSPTANSTTPGGTGNTPTVSPPQGNGGGNANNPWVNARGGGGGGAQGGGQPGCNSGDGGAGFTSCITGSPVGYAGGGGAAGGPSNGPPAPVPMGNGGEGGVVQAPGTDRVPNTFGAGDGAGGSETKTAGTDNRGSGGGGGNPASSGGANGGSGIVVIRYKIQN